MALAKVQFAKNPYVVSPVDVSSSVYLRVAALPPTFLPLASIILARGLSFVHVTLIRFIFLARTPRTAEEYTPLLLFPLT